MNNKHVSWRRPWDNFKTQAQWKEYIQFLIEKSDYALKRAIVQIYERQTYEEQTREVTIEENNAGFNKIDAKVLGDIAEKIKRKQELTSAEIAKSRNKMKKYWKQLMVISLDNERRLMRTLPVSTFQQDEFGRVYDDEEETKNLFVEFCEMMNECKSDGTKCIYKVCDVCPVGNKSCQMKQLSLPFGTVKK